MTDLLGSIREAVFGAEHRAFGLTKEFGDLPMEDKLDELWSFAREAVHSEDLEIRRMLALNAAARAIMLAAACSRELEEKR